MGSQRKTIDEIYEEDKARISIPQILGIFKPSIDKISAQIEKKLEGRIKAQYNERKNKNLVVLKTVPTPNGPMVIDTTAFESKQAESIAQPETPSAISDVAEIKKHKSVDDVQSRKKKKQKVQNL
jgi:hypothetical protein